jgi:hypothetical protein
MIGGAIATATVVGGAVVFGIGVGATGIGEGVTFLGNGIQLLGGYLQSTQGNGQPLLAAEWSAVQSIVSSIAKVPGLPIVDPTDSLVDRLSGENPCGK